MKEGCSYFLSFECINRKNDIKEAAWGMIFIKLTVFSVQQRLCKGFREQKW